MGNDTSLRRVAGKVLTQARELAGLKGVLLVGSTATGTTTPNSDYDFLVMIDDETPWPMPFRDGGRRAWIEDGRQVEVAFTTIGRYHRLTIQEAATGSCLRALGATNARVLWDVDGAMEALVAESRAIVDAGPPAIEQQDVLWECYDLWNQLKDIEDRLADPHVVQVLAASAFTQFVRFFFRLERRWQPRPRDVMPELAAVDPDYHTLSIAFLDARSAEAQYGSLQRMAGYLSARFGLKFEAGYTSLR